MGLLCTQWISLVGQESRELDMIREQEHAFDAQGWPGRSGNKVSFPLDHVPRGVTALAAARFSLLYHLPITSPVSPFHYVIFFSGQSEGQCALASANGVV
jgi:hypothetical protein